MPPRPSPSAPRSSTCSARRRAAGTAASRDSERQGHSLRGGGHEARSRRHLLLPVLLAVQEHVGWISPGALNHIAERLTVPPADVYGVATFYALLSVEPRPPRVVHVCEDLACRCNGSQELIAQLEEHLGRRGRAQRRRLGDVAAQPVPGAVRPGAGGHGHALGRAPRGARARARDRRRRCWRPSTAAEIEAADPVTPLPQHGEDSLRAAGARRARRSGEPRRLPRRAAATRRCGARSSWAARA